MSRHDFALDTHSCVKLVFVLNFISTRVLVYLRYENRLPDGTIPPRPDSLSTFAVHQVI